MALAKMNAENERRWTLEEARLELARRECAREGHYFDVVTVYGSNVPHEVICSRCGKNWKVDK